MMSDATRAERVRCLALANSIVTAFLHRAATPDEVVRLVTLGLDLQAAIGTGRDAPLLAGAQESEEVRRMRS